MLPSQVSAAIYFTLFVVALTGIPARATEVDVPSEASDFIALLAFVSDAQLTDPERERVSAQTQSDLHADSAGVRRTDLKVRKLLASLPRAEAWERADQRETLRLQIEMMPASNPARQIVERHDPTVVFDRAHKRLITEGTLAAWRRACVWMTNLLSVPGPAADFVTSERAYLKANYASLSDAKQEQVAHIERDYPVAVLMFGHVDPAKRAEFVRVSRPLARDRKQLGLRVADTMWQSYDIAMQQQIVNQSILLNAGFNYGGLYHHMYNHL